VVGGCGLCQAYGLVHWSSCGNEWGSL